MDDSLAIVGGPAMRAQESWPKWPIATAATHAALGSVLASRRWSVSGAWTGRMPREQEFGRAWAAFNGVPYCVPTANGTGALVCALEALDVGAGDEVIVPALTWVAPATASLAVNARPVIVDVDPKTMCLDPEAVRTAIGPRTRAILAVHLYGSMVDMTALLAVANGIPVIEDCAQSHGSRQSGKMAGAAGAIGCFSMHQGKVLTSGEGGATITSDAHLARRLEQLRSDGRRYLDRTPRIGESQLTEIGEVQGSNYCLSEFQAAILLDGLQRLESQNRHREANATYLDARIRELGGIEPQARLASVDRQTHYHWLARCNPEAFAGRSSAEISRALEAELGIWFHPPYPALPAHPLYRPLTKRRYRLSEEHVAAIDPSRAHLPVAERVHAESVVFHHSVLLGSRADMDAIVEAFAKVKRHADRIPTLKERS
jgi:dTDP-4-amino-4,6-dideoxygalactose transaminase